MNFKYFLPIIGIFILGLFVSLNVFHPFSGPHGGTVKDVEKYKIEMKDETPKLYVYLLDENSEPIENKGISCEVKLFFADSTSMNLHLIPYEKDGFTNEPGTARFKSCNVTFDLAGHKISARFEGEPVIVKEE